LISKSETAKLLALCAAFDQRTVGEADVEAWHAIFELNAKLEQRRQLEVERLAPKGVEPEPDDDEEFDDYTHMEPKLPLTFDIAKERITDWYSTKRQRIMPADVLDAPEDSGGLW
jgi:hypothetical protein